MNAHDHSAGTDLDYRPESYWTVPESLLANIKGESRRRMVRQAMAEGTVDQLPAKLLSDALPPALLALIAARSHRVLPGETLPDYLPSEVEIARVVYRDTALGDVVSFRARPDHRGIRYRAVDDNATDVPCERKRSAGPLTMGLMIRLIDRGGQGTVYWARQMRGGVRSADLPSFYVVSAFYPQLRRFYAERAAAWMERRRRRPIDPRRLSAIRKYLLECLRWEERTKGIVRTEEQRQTLANDFISLRFTQ